MTKYQRLIKRLIVTGVKCGIALAIAGGIFAGASMYESGATKQKTDAESKLSQDESLLNNLRGQIEKTGAAEKKFIEIQGTRTVSDFAGNYDALKAFLIASKIKHRLSVEVERGTEAPTDKEELKNFSHNVIVWPKVTLKVKAISDVHIFSFIRDLQRSAPGLVHIEKLDIKRSSKTDLSHDTIAGLKSGSSPQLVEATIEFKWIRFEEKTTKENAASPQAAP